MNSDIRFAAQVNECKRIFTPAIIAKIAANEMPECFETTRESYVAMAQLLMQAMHTIEQLAAKQEQHGQDHPRGGNPSSPA